MRSQLAAADTMLPGLQAYSSSPATVRTRQRHGGQRKTPVRLTYYSRLAAVIRPGALPGCGLSPLPPPAPT